jgi:hypothetical protein
MKYKCLAVIVGLLIPALAFGAGDGLAIRGAVADNGRLPLPGAMLKLNGKRVPVQVVYADESGKFDFQGLPVGHYTITAELAGFQSVTAELDVTPAGSRVLEMVLAPSVVVSEAVTVNAEDENVLKKTEPQQKTEISGRTLGQVPLHGPDFQDVLPLVPAVVRGPDGSIHIGGARAAESSLLVNGSNVTDPVTGNFAIELPLEAVQNVQVFTNPYSAEFGKFIGGVTKVSTKPGEDNFKFEFNDFVPRFHFTDGLKTEGVEAWTPRIRFSGPTGMGNLYYSQAFTYNYNRTFMEDLPEGQDSIKNIAFDSFTQLDYAPSTQHQMTLTLSFYPQDTSHVGLSTFLPVASTPDIQQRGHNLAFQDRYFFNDGAFLESTFGLKSYDVSVVPREDVSTTVFTLTPEGDHGSYFNYQDRDSDRIGLVESYTSRQFHGWGTHQLITGLDLGHTSYSGFISYSQVDVRRENGSLYETTRFIGSGDLGHSGTELSSFLQDQWLPVTSLALNLGLRMDYDSVSAAANLSPRLALSYAPPAFPGTVFKSGVGFFYDKIYLNAADFEDYPSRIIDRYDESGQLVSQTTLINRLDGGIRTPRSLTWNVEVDQRMTPKVLLRTNFLARTGDRQMLLEPTGHVFLLTNNGRSRYWEWELTAEYRVDKDTNLYFSYVRSHAKGDTNDFNTYLGNMQSPLVHENAYANLPFDTPSRFLFWGVIRVPWKVHVSPVLEIRNGFAYSAVDENQNFVGPRNELRYPAFAQLDLRITRTFRVMGKYEVTLGVKVLNALNHFNPRDVQNNIDSNAVGTFYNGVGRLFRGAFEIKF